MDGLPPPLTHDVLVIGAGVAGLRAAIEARTLGRDVAVVCKSLLGKAHSVMASGPLATRADWKDHFRETMRAGRYLASWRMVQLLAMEAPERVTELEAWGAVFDPAFERSGLEVVRTLQQRAVSLGVRVYMEHTITRLFGDHEGVTGALGYRRDTGAVVAFEARAVVLATGGLGRAFEMTSSSWENTGDGQALAYLAGAELVDPELVEFHPLGIVEPPSLRGRKFSGDRALLRNARGQAIGNADEPSYLIARAIRSEVIAGRGTPHGGVWLGSRAVGATVWEVGPTAHYGLGGVRVDAETQETTVKGLFAAGECAGGLHGSHRLGENALTADLVLGRRAGLHAGEHAKTATARGAHAAQLEAGAKEVLAPFAREEGPSSFEVHDDLRDVMSAYCGSVKNEPDLLACLDELGRLAEELGRVSVTGGRAFNAAWHGIFDVRNLLLVSEAMARAALARKESRGEHAREDFPEPDPELAKVNHVARRTQAGMEIQAVPIPQLPEEIQAVLLEEEL